MELLGGKGPFLRDLFYRGFRIRGVEDDEIPVGAAGRVAGLGA